MSGDMGIRARCPTINTIRGTIWGRAVQLLLTLLGLKLLHLFLLLEDLLALDGGEEIVSLEVFRVVMANTLLLHLSILLHDIRRIAKK